MTNNGSNLRLQPQKKDNTMSYKQRGKTELAEDIEFLNSLALKKRNENEPGRWEYVLKSLRERGYKPVEDKDNKCIKFSYNGNTITVFPYTGWFTGKGVKDGRGIRKLLNQI